MLVQRHDFGYSRYVFILLNISHSESTRIKRFLCFVGYVALFTLPKVYENNKQSIDAYLDLVRSKILEITDK